MKKFTSLLIGCSLALVGAAVAQLPEEQQSPTKTKKEATEKPHAAEAKHGAEGKHGANANAANPEATTSKQHVPKNERAAGAKGLKMDKAEATPKTEAATTGAGASATGEASVSPAPGGKHQAGQSKKGMKGAGANTNANAKVSPSASPVAAASASASPVAAASPSASAAPSVAAGAQTNAQTNAQPNANVAGGGGKKKADPQKVQQIKQQHANFRAQPKPDKVPAVTFNQSYRIEGSDRWQGQQYEAFRSYHPERHDQRWYHSHYPRVELVGGGYYYMNNGYWYPAWGYNSANEYYAYDGPIYVGHRAEPPDKVIADVQAELQEMGYYKGEVDGLLGPLTREALTAYQTENGLATTAAIDEPTLDALGMG
jgi:hypothetical protein